MDDQTIVSVWMKGEFFNDSCRKDQCGALMKFEAYGDRQSPYGWEIDHITPESKGGTDALSNLRPLHWKNNASRQENRLNTINPTVKAFLVDDIEKTWRNAEYNEGKGKYYWLK